MKVFLCLLVVINIVVPRSLADASSKGEFLLSQIEVQQILQSAQAYFTNQRSVVFTDLTGEEQAAVFTLRRQIKRDFLQFLPGFVSTETVKLVLNAATQVKKIPETTLKTLFTEIEKLTVQEAVKAGTDWLLQNKVEVASGNITDENSGFQFQYLITYQEVNSNQADVVIEFYSAEHITPPPPTASFSMGVPYFASELAAGQVRPFIIHVETRVQRIGLGLAIDASANTKVSVEFPDEVPKLELAKELPYPIEEQKINLLNKLTAVQKVFDALGDAGIEVFGTLGNGVGMVKEVTEDFFSFVSKVVSLGGAGLLEPEAEKQLSFVKKTLEQQANDNSLNLVRGEGEEDIQEILSQAKRDLDAAENKDVVQNETIVQISTEEEELKGDLEKELNTLEQEEEDLDSAEKEESAEELNQVKNKDQQNSALINETIVPISAQREGEGEESQEDRDTAQKGEADSASADELHTSVQDQVFCQISESEEPKRNRVIFSKIAWMGTTTSANDEWIELQNQTFLTLDLTGWQVLDQDRDIEVMFEGPRISSGGTLLLERTDDTSNLAQKADVIYTGSLRNSNEALYLFDENCKLQDKVAAAPDWPGGKNDTKEVMMRYSDFTWGSRAYAQHIGGVSSGGGGSSNSQTEEKENKDERQEEEGEEETMTWCSQENLASPVHTSVIINEVAWMGTSASSNDEWIELTNISDKEVNLENWQILDKAEQIQISFTPEDAVAPGGFYLLERTDDTTIPNVTADLIYTGALSNSEESLRLFDDKCNLVDEVLADPDWPKGDNESKRSMERGSDLLWYQYTGAGESGIFGTPKAENNYNEPESDPEPEAPEESQEPESQPQQAQTDTTAPVVTFKELSSVQNDIAFSVSWEAADPLGAVTPSGLDAFSLLYTVTPAQDGVFLWYWQDDQEKEWSQGSGGTLSLDSTTDMVSLSGKDGVSYVFSITAKDKQGNESQEDTAETKIELAKSVAINEIAWMGTQASTSDEWIELYNTTGADIDLAGWELRAEDGTPIIELTGTIAAQGYFLLERTDDTTISDIAADQIYTGALGNEGEALKLYDSAGVIIDVVDASSSWFFGDNTTKQSMERIVAFDSGSESSNWANNNLLTHNGQDADGGLINGTPGKENSVSLSETTISSLRLNEFDSITLTKLGSPYNAVWLKVPPGKTLVVEPGVEIKFENNRGDLTVQGTLKAVGESANGITFASDTGSPWCGVWFTPTSVGSELYYLTIDKAASGGSGCKGNHYAVWVQESDITLKNTTITTGNTHRKLHLQDSDSLIDSVTLSGADFNNSSAAIYVAGGSPTIQNSTISDSTFGVFSDGALSTPTIQNNTFTGNTYPVKLNSSGAVLSGNTATNNTYNGILVEGGVYSTDVMWKADTMPYLVNKFTVQAGKTLTIEAGTQVQFINAPYSGPELVVHGTLLAQGTADNLVTFTKAPSAPNWKRIHFTSSSTGSVLQHAQFDYGGSALGKIGVLYVEGEVSVQNVTIQNSPYVGLYSEGTVTGSDISFADNAYAFRLALAQCPILANVTISGSGEDFYPGSLECGFE